MNREFQMECDMYLGVIKKNNKKPISFTCFESLESKPVKEYRLYLIICGFKNKLAGKC